jgi:hypothetical protein
MIAGHTSWTHPPHTQRMFDCSLYQRNRARNRKDHVPRGIAMALTFGTLLSSQGADAHLSDPFRSLWGNPRYFTRSASLGQTGTARAPAWSSGRGGRVARAWGTSDRLHDVRGSVRRTLTTLAPGSSASKPVPMPPPAADPRGAERPRHHGFSPRSGEPSAAFFPRPAPLRVAPRVRRRSARAPGARRRGAPRRCR